jgi:hypothetical protein
VLEDMDEDEEFARAAKRAKLINFSGCESTPDPDHVDANLDDPYFLASQQLLVRENADEKSSANMMHHKPNDYGLSVETIDQSDLSRILPGLIDSNKVNDILVCGDPTITPSLPGTHTLMKDEIVCFGMVTQHDPPPLYCCLSLSGLRYHSNI